jgi:branched-chain amino acid transport system ATP-binding protein
MLRIDSLEASYDQNQVLFGASLEVRSGEVVALMGRNGMGKTTTVHSVVGVVRPRAGSISFEGRTLNDLPPYRIARLGIGLVPEGRELFPPLKERSNQLGSTLSGGEQQMLAIGRALMLSPKLLILDEATEGLAPLIRDEIWSCLQRLKDLGQSILLIDKNLDELAHLADRSYVMEKGRIVWEGATPDLIRNEELRLAYLGV